MKIIFLYYCRVLGGDFPSGRPAFNSREICTSYHLSLAYLENMFQAIGPQIECQRELVIYNLHLNVDIIFLTNQLY